ncbi:PLP-dependent aminotransferase family protein [Actinocorallia sp. A-T 12471]|uniref:aminotransferase-like domain-containing protein n=1 Tax=Actinocorallia sp. A-T 12471 TaxID=3089813 RepID=UPI0029CD1D1D|nr:PLP-dependent aminotransferase family protein [Actinocorallia sp. A-T 12471]MDX6738591.1 PLP-dependent aminotransferase family protein [Actinocorallia sp. A-T 12471]
MGDLHVAVDRTAGRLAAQLAAGLRAAVREGRLAGGARLPSSRSLAADLGVSRGVVVAAYEQLVAEGFLLARTGDGTRVAHVPASRATRTHGDNQRVTPVEYDFRPGRPDLAQFPRARWAAAYKHALDTMQHDDFAYPDPAGVPPLREELAAYLGRVRAADTSPDLIVITSGVAHALSIIAHLLTGEDPGSSSGEERVGPLAVANPQPGPSEEHASFLAGEDPGSGSGGERAGLLAVGDPGPGSGEGRTSLLAGEDPTLGSGGEPTSPLAGEGRGSGEEGGGLLAVEDPTSERQIPLLEAAGARVVRIPVDAEGLDVAALARSGARAVLVTPAHQFPTGVVLSPARRAALVDWARRTGGVIVEDDYDAEFRYDREPVGCVQGLAPDRTVLLGSLSKALAPGLRLGWLAAPARLAEAAARHRARTDLGAPVVEQHALARFLASGAHDHQVRKVRRVYRARRDALVAALARALPEARVGGVSAGLHVYVEIPGLPDDAETRAAHAGVAVQRCGPGLVLGYGGVSERRIPAGISRLARALTP